jgi:hypothetical protein
MKITTTKKSVGQILKLHAEILDAARTSLPKAIKIGELLTGLKEKMEHGQWLPWIQKNLSFSDRTAARYIKCFSESDRLGKFDSVTNLTDAYELLSEPKAKPAPLPPTDSGRVARAAELDAQIIQSIADIKTAAADFGDGELPPGFIGFNDMKEFFASKGKSLDIELTDADEAGFRVLEFYLANGAVVSRETVLECLRQFNPARQLAKAA